MTDLKCVADAIFGDRIERVALAIARSIDGQLMMRQCFGYTETEAQCLIERLSVMGEEPAASAPVLIETRAPPSGFAETGHDQAAGFNAERHACIALTGLPGAGRIWLVARLPEDGDDVIVRERLKAVMPMLAHLRRSRLEGLLAGLAQSAPASFIVTGDGEVLAATAAASRLAAGAPLAITDGRLRVSPADLRERLTAAIAAVIAGEGTAEPPIEILTLAKATETTRPRLLIVQPLPRTSPGAAPNREQGLCWISLSTPELSHAPTIRRLRAAWPQLTEAEADVVRGIMLGLSVKEIATARKRAEDTISKHLKSIYKKTDCSGQNQLILQVATVLGHSHGALPAAPAAPRLIDAD